MPWYELTADVMVRGTPRAYGEVLDLSPAEGQLLSGLGRAKPAQPPAKPEAAAKQDVVAVESPAEDVSVPTAPVKTVVRRRTTPSLTKD